MQLPQLARGALGLTLPVAVAAALVPVRTDIDDATTALALALTVVVVALLGGALAAGAGAVAAALSFNVLHTEPYGSPAIDAGEDVLTVVLLLAVGLLTGQLVANRAYAEASLEERRDDLRRVRAVGRASRSDPAVLVQRLERDLVELLDLRTARWEPGAVTSILPRITASGIVVPSGSPRLAGDDPSTWALELPVVRGDTPAGRFVLQPARPTSGASLPPGRRDLALTYADQLGLALGRPWDPIPTNGASRA